MNILSGRLYINNYVKNVLPLSNNVYTFIDYYDFDTKDININYLYLDMNLFFYNYPEHDFSIIKNNETNKIIYFICDERILKDDINNAYAKIIHLVGANTLNTRLFFNKTKIIINNPYVINLTINNVKSIETQTINLDKQVGLTNHINTCFFNSLIQALFRVTRLFNYINTSSNIIISNTEEKHSGGKLLKELYYFYTMYFDKSKPALNEPLLRLLRVFQIYFPDTMNGAQQDSGELLTFLLNDFSYSDTSINKLYQITTNRTYTCNNKSCSRYGIVTDMPTEVDNILKLYNGNTIDELIKDYRIQKYNITCIECKINLNVKLKEIKTSEILFIMLVRTENFVNDLGEYQVVKKSNSVYLKLTETINNVKYNLKSFIYHLGKDISGGHYKAVSIDTVNQKYTVYNDSTFKTIKYTINKNNGNLELVNNSDKYFQNTHILMYERDE